MNTDPNYPQSQPPVIIPPQGQPAGPGAMGHNFTTEELRVLRECNSESFWYRSLPIGSALGVGTWLAIQRGVIGGSAKWGSYPKVALSCVLGYFIGKFSYQQKCAEKMMQLPNSRLAEALRRRKKGEYFEVIRPDGGLSMAPFSGSTDVYTDENLKQQDQFKSAQANALDLDLDRPFNSGLDDTFRPNLDTPDRNFDDNLPSEPPKSTTTYEELRRQNRADYEKKMQNPYYRPLPDDAPHVSRPLQPPQQGNQPIEPTGPKNKYGDVWVK